MAGSIEASTIRSPAASIWAHARLFAFACVSLGVFLIGLCLMPTAVRGYVVRAVLGLRIQANDTVTATSLSRDSLSQIRDEYLSTEQIRTALGKVGPPPHTDRMSSEAFPNSAEIEYVRQRLSIAPEHTPVAGEARLALTYTGLNSAWSVSLLDRLAAQVIESLDERAAKEAERNSSSQLRAGLTAAQQREQRARTALDDFLDNHFSTLNRSGRSATSGLASKEQSKAQPAIPSPRINPKWQSLHEQLNALTAERERILLDRTPEHPQAKEAEIKIESLRQLLEQTAKFLVEDEPSVSANRRSEKTIRPAQFAADSTTGAGREYEQLLAELRKARQERQAAEREVEFGANSNLRPALPDTVVVRGRVVATAHLVQTLREAPSTGRLTLLALGAIFVGACVAALIRLPASMPVYFTLAQVEKDLSLPVVGVVSPASHSAAAMSR